MGARSQTTRKAAFCSALVLIATLAAGQAQAAPKEDPLEGLNRAGYAIHQFFDHILLRPLARTYQALVPTPIRNGFRHVISNMEEPGVMANDFLQGHPVRAARTLTRFVGNSTLGIGGLFDVAKKVGLTHHDNGFGDTFGRYGIGPGPYLFIPLYGPTTFRDLLGGGVDIVTDPFTWARFDQRTVVIDTRHLVGGLDQRAQNDDQLKAIDNMSTDSYASLRSLYLQDRASEIADVISGGAPVEPVLPDFDAADPTPPAAAGPAGPTPPPTPSPATASADPSTAPTLPAPAEPSAPAAVEQAPAA